VEPFNATAFQGIVRCEYVNEPTGRGSGVALEDIQGFSALNQARFGVGIGSSVSSFYGDQNYHAPSSSWLLATFDYMCSAEGQADIYLQIGSEGMNHQNEMSQFTNVVFGALTDAPLNAKDKRLVSSSSPEAHITVKAATAISSDFDRDGDVDGADFITWQRGLGTTEPAASRAAGDANGDAVVDGNDLSVWQSNFGVVGQSTISQAPEPSVLAMVLAIIAAGFASRRFPAT
jgi:hypothetical protein